MGKQIEQIEGVLKRIIFKNDSGFIIGAFLDEYNNKFTGLGTMINPQIEMNYIFSGYYEENHKFGEQFKFIDYETVIPVDASGIFKYIVRICKFVGSTVGNKIIDKYGANTLKIMKNQPEKLAQEISGITLDRAKKIQSTLLENEKTEKIMIELGLMLDIPGMRKSLQADLIKTYKSNSVEIIKENPYILTQFAGIGFPLADRVALNIGFARDSIERKKAVVLHCLKENMQAGSVWISSNDLTIKIQELIQVPDLRAGIDILLKDKIIVHYDKIQGFYALAIPAQDESFIAEKLMEMNSWRQYKI